MIEAPLSPTAVLEQVAESLPGHVRGSVIIIGSLAAGYHFFAGDGNRAVRTKDVDALFVPHSKAVIAAAEVTDELIDAKWTLREGTAWSKPGTKDDAEESLPMVRLVPPDHKASSWFLELLSAPPQFEPGAPAKKLRRVETKIGHFAICSFDYLALVEWEPLKTTPGVRIARPEMMALANMLHHPSIGDAVIFGTTFKRSNKDLGRVLALAYLTLERDRREGTEELAEWPGRMWQALQQKFDAHAAALAAQAGGGIRALLDSQADLDSALHMANIGLLTSLDVSREAFRATGERFVVEVLDELEAMAK